MQYKTESYSAAFNHKLYPKIKCRSS